MLTSSCTTLLLLTLLPEARAQKYAIDPPPSTLTLCRPYTFAWGGGTPPYTLSIRIPTGHIDVPVELPFMNIWKHTFTWTPDLVENGMVMRLFDSTGASATSSSFSVQAGDDTACVKGKGTSKTSDSSSTGPMPDTVRVGAALYGLSDEAIWGIFAAAACLFLGVVGLVLWLWLRRRERGHEVDYAASAFDDDSWEPTSRLSMSWTLGQRLHAMGIPTIVVTSPTNASSIFSFAVDGPRGRSPKPPSVVLFDAAEAEVHAESADSHTPLRREADDNEFEDAPLLGAQQTLSPPVTRSKSPKLRALVI